MTLTISGPTLGISREQLQGFIYASSLGPELAHPAPTKFFDDARDNPLIAKGTHFYCLGHLRAVPVEECSPRNIDYCCQCLEITEGERKKDKGIDTWAGEIFIHHGKKYTVHADIPKTKESYQVEIKTYCLGGVKSQVPSEKITTILLQPIKPSAASRNTSTDIITVTSDRKCGVCQKPITWGNKKTKYCSDPCQKKAYLMRKDVSKCL